MFLEKKQLGIFVGVYGIYLSSIVWCLIYFKILYTPEILYGYKFLRKKSKENKDYIIIKTFQWQLKKNYEINNNQELQLRDKIIKNIENYVTEIELVIDENQFFRDPNFTLNELAFKLNIPKSHLLYLFKYHSKISFLDLKKTIRIQDAVILINNGYLKKNTYDSLAKKVGFLSYNPFFTSFKDIVGISPNKYNSNTTTISKKIS
ncbi:AraC family transcriptional regulator [uncultured Flavobacterium sp.]|uniref:helix-turn-helix domain-containing protein n=1 Tax=uncultured Flavobacterium sp. TaxID=165435 RepID=UPI0030CA47DD